MNNSIKFSVCIPIYNTESFLEECIESVLNQTYQDFEIILVDDGSTDSSGEICDTFSCKDSRITVYHNENRGLMATRSFAVSKATGDYIIHLDSDDYLDIDALKIIFENIKEHAADCVIYYWEKVYNHEPVTNANIQIPHDEPLILLTPHDFYRFLLSSDANNSLCVKCFTKKHYDIDFSDFFHLSLGEDLLQSLYLLQKCEKVVVIPEKLYKYNINPNSMTQTIDWNKEKITFEIREVALNFLQETSAYTEDEMKDYHLTQVGYLISQIVSIANATVPFSRKKELFDAIHSSNYYQTFLCKPVHSPKRLGLRRFSYYLFQKKMYRLMIFGHSVYHFLKRLFTKPGK